MATLASTGREPVSGRAVTIIGAVLAIGALAELYTLLQFWPATPSIAQTAPATATVGWLLWSVVATREQQLFIVIATAGALGGTVHALRSFSWYTGIRNLRWSWVPRLMTLPFVGSLMAVVLYLALRGGLMGGPESTDAASPFGFAALAALTGIFTEQAVVHLKKVFETLLSESEKGPDAKGTPTIDDVDPGKGPAGTEVVITGSGLKGATVVRFGTAEATPSQVSDSRVSVLVPPGASTGPLAVVTPRGEASSPGDFQVQPPQESEEPAGETG